MEHRTFLAQPVDTYDPPPLNRMAEFFIDGRDLLEV